MGRCGWRMLMRRCGIFRLGALKMLAAGTIPIDVLSVGSGKGRVLFVAAEYPFRKVIGVEFSNALHDDAVANLKRYRFPKRRCADIEPVHADAREFEFPNDNLVIYLFNPFGEEVMEGMLANLERSLERILAM